MDNKNKVSIHTTTVSATGVECDNGKMKVLKGTTMKAYGAKDMAKAKATYQKLLKNGVINVEDSTVTFVKDSEFASADEAASFLLHRGGKNESAWIHTKPLNKPKKMEKGTVKKKVTTSKAPTKKTVDSPKKPTGKKTTSKTPTKSVPAKKTTGNKPTNTSSQKNKKRGNLRNPRGIKPQGVAAVEAAQEVQNSGFVRFAGMVNSISNKKR